MGEIIARRERVTMRAAELRTTLNPLTLAELRAFVAAADAFPDSAPLYTLSGAHLSGVRLSVSERKPECDNCNGAGVTYPAPDRPEVCEPCGGTGEPIVDAEVDESVWTLEDRRNAARKMGNRR